MGEESNPVCPHSGIFRVVSSFTNDAGGEGDVLLVTTYAVRKLMLNVENSVEYDPLKA